MIDSDFVLSIETECLTAIEALGTLRSKSAVFTALLRQMREYAPSLPGCEGIFNPYGRIYVDVGSHLELAAAECDSPYTLALLVETQQMLVARTVEWLTSLDVKLTLANNNHSGLLHAGAATWGTHENHMVRRHPTTLGAEILPFLCSRIYAGAGGLHFPDGRFLAGVRPLFMERDREGSTTGRRAIHSTCREEHHAGGTADRFRYHLLLGDGHRSQFNLALQLGATALALKAIDFDPELGACVGGDLGLPVAGGWLGTLQRFNQLAVLGRPPAVDPLALRIQRLYLEGARRYAASLSQPPTWIAQLLSDWQDTLDAMEYGELDWLAARLDAYTKYKLYGEVLGAAGQSWNDLHGDRELFVKLALLDQDYHSFSNPHSIFAQLERDGLLHHRVGAPILAGTEEEPFIPALATRARPRARFLVANRDRQGIQVDWAGIVDYREHTIHRLSDPLADEFQSSQDPPEELALRLRLARARRRLAADAPPRARSAPGS